MKAKKVKTWTGIIAALCMLLMILDPNTVHDGAVAGTEICTKTVIPSLFPFFVLSGILSGSYSSPQWLRPLGKLCGIPQGAEGILLLGMCGGYPVGAKSLYHAYHGKALSKSDAERMLHFCSNAGPSFIFGISAVLFASWKIAWFLWGIQIISMIITAVTLPNKSQANCRAIQTKQEHPMHQAVVAMATVCGWVIFMRVILCLLQNYGLGKIPKNLVCAITGFLELSNGCITLSEIINPAIRYVRMGQFLSFGGICILLQTSSLIGDLNIKNYAVGKMMQTVFASALLFLSLPIAFPGTFYWKESTVWIALSLLLIIYSRVKRKNNTGNYPIYAV